MICSNVNYDLFYTGIAMNLLKGSELLVYASKFWSTCRIIYSLYFIAISYCWRAYICCNTVLEYCQLRLLFFLIPVNFPFLPTMNHRLSSSARPFPIPSNFLTELSVFPNDFICSPIFFACFASSVSIFRKSFSILIMSLFHVSLCSSWCQYFQELFNFFGFVICSWSVQHRCCNIFW